MDSVIAFMFKSIKGYMKVKIDMFNKVPLWALGKFRAKQLADHTISLVSF